MPALRPRPALRLATALLVLLAVGYGVAFKLGRVAAHPRLMAWMVGLAALALAGSFVAAASSFVRGRRLRELGEALAAGGLLLTAVAGLANWALGLQGVVVVAERQPTQLGRIEGLAGFEAGPLANRAELAVTLALVRLELAPAGPDGFRPVSHLKALDAAGEERWLSIAPERAAPFGGLVFHQGAFGFAPRVVVSQGGHKLLDTHVPFRTVREGPRGLAFVEDFEIAAEKLLFHGAVTLGDLNDDMKGHPELELLVEREGKQLGGGRLRPGESAELEGGLQVTFAGVQRWSEVLFSRRSYSRWILAGAAIALAGALLWPLAAWRRW